jgi:hypothetical protein
MQGRHRGELARKWLLLKRAPRWVPSLQGNLDYRRLLSLTVVMSQ